MTRPPLMPMKPLPLSLSLVLTASLLALGLSCSSQGGATYERGTLTRPPPAQQRPGVGAPIVGQPGRGQAVPRSPHKRALPQTPSTMREPGIWAGDQPVASINTSRPELGGVQVLITPELDTEAGWTVVRMCTDSMDRVIDETGLINRLRLLDEKEHICVVAHLMKGCATVQWNTYERKAKTSPKRPVLEDLLKKLLRLGDLFIEMSCTGVPLTDEMVALRKEIGEAWIKSNNGQLLR